MIYLLLVATKLSALMALLFFVCGLIVSFKSTAKAPLALLFASLFKVMFHVAYACTAWLGIYFVFTCDNAYCLV